MTIRHMTKPQYLLVVFVLVMQACAPIRLPGSTGMMVGPPKSLDELVKRADIIVLGKVGEVHSSGYFAGYDDSGKAKPAQAPDNPRTISAPYTDFVITVERVFKMDSSLSPDQPVLLRMLGHTTQEPPLNPPLIVSEFPMSHTGDQHLFFLTRNPDGLTYGFYYGPWSRFNVDGALVTVSGGERPPVKFSDSDKSFTPDELYRHIEQIVNIR